MTPAVIALAVAGVLVVVVGWIAILVSMNRFVAQRNFVLNSWSNVDTELKRRYDLIPSLVETVRGYASHERSTFERVARARGQAMQAIGSPPAAQAAAEAALIGALRNLIAVAESHPQLRASGHFRELQQELANTEDRIQAARRFYNANVADYNRRVHSFPSLLTATLFGYAEMQFFQVEPAVHVAPVVRFDLA